MWVPPEDQDSIFYHAFDAQVRRMLWRRPQLGSLSKLPQIASSMPSQLNSPTGLNPVTPGSMPKD